MKKISTFLIACSLATPVWAQSDMDEMMFPADSRIRILPYDESDIYTIPTKYGFQTNIVFSKNEEIEAISMGDRSLWQIIPAGHRLFIRPMLEDVTTNMTVLTNKRSYQFDIKSVGEDSKNTSIIYVAKFIYPEDTKDTAISAYDEQISNIGIALEEPPAVAEPAATPVAMPEAMPAPVATAAAPAAAMPPTPAPAIPSTTYATPHPVMKAPGEAGIKNANYTFAGPDELAPLQVYDDGKSTYFKYREANQPLPNAYITDSSGKEKPVGHYIKDGLMVVDDIAGEWVLKSSSGTIMVYNEVLNPQSKN